MYEKFFHLKKRPFSIAPDPGFLYMSERHRDALAHLKYGLESEGGFVLVTGEVGTGKTTLLRNLIGQVPGDIDVAFILNPRLTVRELLQTICDELAIDYPTEDQHSVKPYIDRLNKHLLRTHQMGRSTVVVIDEAQNLSPAVLEQLRLLTNLETNERKLLRIILVGQPELKTMLARQELRQLSQRITARYHLQPLKLDDTRAYLAHRLMVSGGNPNLFTNGASWNIHRHAGGIPRLINIIADRSMLGAYADNKPRIDFQTTQKAARETLNRDRNIWSWLAVAGAVLLTIGIGWILLDGVDESPADAQREARVEPRDQSPTQMQSRPQPVTQPDRDTPRSSASELTEIVVRPPGPTDSRSGEREIVLPPKTPTIDTPIDLNVAIRPPSVTTQDAASNRTEAPRTAVAQETIANVAAVERPPPTRLSPLPGIPAYRSQRLAFAKMYELWGITYEPADSLVPCDYAPRYQLQCTKRVNAWPQVAKLNVPVVLKLKGPSNLPFYVTAVSATNSQVSVEQNGQLSTVNITELESVWDGTMIALWPTPENYRGSLKNGSEGQAVRELRTMLGPALGRNLGNSRRFDSTLASALREFQDLHSLEADGIAGPATWLLLHRAAGYDIPQLQG